MLRRMSPSLRESSPFLVTGLRLVDSAMVAMLIYPIVIWHIGAWSDHYEILMSISFVLTLVVFHAWGRFQP